MEKFLSNIGDNVRKGATYALPFLTAMSLGKVNPFPTTSKYHDLIVPGATFLVTYITLRLHPNGVNGPAVPPKVQ